MWDLQEFPFSVYYLIEWKGKDLVLQKERGGLLSLNMPMEGMSMVIATPWPRLPCLAKKRFGTKLLDSELDSHFIQEENCVFTRLMSRLFHKWQKKNVKGGGEEKNESRQA